MANPVKYVKETRAELRHVSWPTRKQTVQFTGLVILVSLITALLLGFFDFIFDYLLELFILNS